MASKLNRRGFLATLAGAAVAPFLPKPKSEPIYEHKQVGSMLVYHPDHAEKIKDILASAEEAGESLKLSKTLVAFDGIFGKPGT